MPGLPHAEETAEYVCAILSWRLADGTYEPVTVPDPALGSLMVNLPAVLVVIRMLANLAFEALMVVGVHCTTPVRCALLAKAITLNPGGGANQLAQSLAPGSVTMPLAL